VVIATFMVAWAASYILYRSQRLDDLEVRVSLQRDIV
jgi:hypothetical protein